MKYFFRIAIAGFFFCCCIENVFSQTGSAIDKYLGNTPKLSVIATSSDNISVPTDLDFSPVPSRKNELWVVNYGTYNSGGNMVIIYDAGKPTQWSEQRHDVYSQHFMIAPTALAMGSADSGYFATTGEVLNNTNDPTSTFMGPVLWDSDTTKFARINQNNNLLGSHIDMLHQSPYSMGIAFDTLNAYWDFDGYHGCLYHYDFKVSHGWGNDNHADGEILKYKEVKLKRIANLPSHMIVDHSTGWLYIVDNGNKRIVRVDTKSGELGNDLTAPNENPAVYSEMIGVGWQTIDSGFTNLSGIDYFDGRLIVGNYGTGDIRVYNTKTSGKPTYMGTIQTGDAGMIGLKIGPDSNIWYVNRTKNKVVKLTPGVIAPLDAALLSPPSGATQVGIPATLSWVKITGALSYHLQVSLASDFTTTIYDSAGITATSINFPNLNNSTTYFWRAAAKNTAGEGKWTSVWNFKTIGAKPDIIALTSPVNGAANISLNPTLTWDSLKSATGYNLQVSDRQDFMGTIVDQTNIMFPRFAISNLAGKTPYYWRVKGLNDGAIGDWSDVWSFTTLDPASVNEGALAKSKLTIDEIYPNPSSVNSIVNFTLSESQKVRIALIDLLGREIAVLANENYQSGSHTLSMNSASLPSGTYFYQFTTPQGIERKSFVVRK